MADEASKLAPEAEAFYKTLPPADYPAALIDTYPRIANQIVALRLDNAALSRYFESLIADERGSRAGFPFAVIVDIQNLFDALVGIPGGFLDSNSLLHDMVKK